MPVLRTHPFLRIWSAGCSTGEEAYSLAILLEEEGLLDRSRIYATDASEHVLGRNVLIYFGKPLQDRVHGLIHASLAPFGVLGLGSRESVRFTAREADYEPVAAEQHLYRRIP